MMWTFRNERSRHWTIHQAFDDFTQHGETEIDLHNKWKEAEEYVNQFLKKGQQNLKHVDDSI